MSKDLYADCSPQIDLTSLLEHETIAKIPIADFDDANLDADLTDLPGAYFTAALTTVCRADAMSQRMTRLTLKSVLRWPIRTTPICLARLSEHGLSA